MHADTLAFLGSLLECCDRLRPAAFLTLTAIHPDGGRLSPSRHVPLDNADALSAALARLLRANHVGWGAYVAVGLRNRQLGRYRRGGNGNVVALPALYADVDYPPVQSLPALRAFSPKPSCIVNSGAGLHGYWWLVEPTQDLTRASQILRVLREELRGDGVSVSQSLRLPGTANTKANRGGALCHLVELNDYHYHLDDFALPAPKTVHPHTTVHTLHPSRRGAANGLNPTLIRVVTETLLDRYEGYAKPNGYIASLCPCGHVHDQPGSHFNFDPARGVGRCFGRHGRLLLKELCQALSIDPKTYGGYYAAIP
jgi:hypothetical protein